jgi:hypothetical protein
MNNDNDIIMMNEEIREREGSHRRRHFSLLIFLCPRRSMLRNAAREALFLDETGSYPVRDLPFKMLNRLQLPLTGGERRGYSLKGAILPRKKHLCDSTRLKFLDHPNYNNWCLIAKSIIQAPTPFDKSWS